MPLFTVIRYFIGIEWYTVIILIVIILLLDCECLLLHGKFKYTLQYPNDETKFHLSSISLLAFIKVRICINSHSLLSHCLLNYFSLSVLQSNQFFFDYHSSSQTPNFPINSPRFHNRKNKGITRTFTSAINATRQTGRRPLYSLINQPTNGILRVQVFH